jgi:protein TonB
MDTPPEPKPTLQFRPKRVERPITAQKKEVIRKREKPPAVIKSKPTPIIRDKPITPPKEEIPPIPPASVSPALQRGITDTNPPVAKEKVEEPPLVTPELPAEGKNVQPSLIPKEGNAAVNDRITLARPRYDRNPKPRYPRIARRRGYEGLVVLKVEILPDGRVGKVRVKRSSGHHILDKSALKTVKMWKFIPARRGDDPIRMWAEVPIKFDLQ